MSPVRIADELNARGVPGPRGRPWQGTAIRSHRNRGSGILNNQAYIGLIVFNCLAYRKNPATERRVSRENAVEHHVVQEVPSLRIVECPLATGEDPRGELARGLGQGSATVRPDGFAPRTCQGSASSALHAYRYAREPSPERHYVPAATTKLR